MNRFKNIGSQLIVLGILIGCSDSQQEPITSVAMSSESQEGQNSGPHFSREIQAEDRQRAFRRASLIFLNQAPTNEELQTLVTEADYESAIDDLVESPLFVAKMKSYHQEFFKLSGQEEGVNLNEPANLAAYLVRENQDFRDILRADYCVDDNLSPIGCSSFSNSESEAQQQGAGVVTTQAFLKKWEGAFSFNRTSQMLQAFACQEYPDETDLGMKPEEISEEEHTFACTNCTPKCYSCHRTMNARASLFYKFDTSGVFNLNPSNSLAIKRDNGQVSTTADLLKPGVKPRFGLRKVASLKEYAYELSRTSKFRNCLAKRFTLLSLGSNDLEVELPTLLNQAPDLMIRNSYRIKDFFKELLRSDGYVLQ